MLGADNQPPGGDPPPHGSRPPTPPSSSEPPQSQSPHSANRLVLKNTLFLVGAKVLTAPLSVLVTAVIARHLGAADYSYIYLASTFTGFGMLCVIFGQSGALPAMVAVDRTRAGELLGTSLVWRLASGGFVYGVVALACVVLGYDLVFHQALALVFMGALVMAIAGACVETIRGYERTDVDAYLNVGATLVTAGITIPLVLLGGGLMSVLSVGLVTSTAAVVFVSRFLRPVGVPRLSASRSTLKELLHRGYPFFFFSLAAALQPTVDAAFLSRLAPAEAVGWYAASAKLEGLIVFPASALVTALYPTLCRLYADQREQFNQTTRSTLQTATLLTVPVAAGCGLFPELGYLVYGSSEFEEVADNLRVLSLHLFLVYMSMPLGSAILAAGRARAWSVVQALCVVVSAVVDPILIPWFQAKTGNGGLGVCWASVASEVMMVSLGIWLLPSGVLAIGMLRPMLAALAGGGSMAVVAYLLGGFPALLVAPIALVVYAFTLWLTGALSRDQIVFLKSVVRKKRAPDAEA